MSLNEERRERRKRRGGARIFLGRAFEVFVGEEGVGFGECVFDLEFCSVRYQRWGTLFLGLSLFVRRVRCLGSGHFSMNVFASLLPHLFSASLR